jgi:Holin of 3TMs, for gene-transfer release
MPQTLLARKSGPQDNAIATDDDHHEALASDPQVSAFPQGSAFGSTNGFGNTTNGATAFGAPSAGGFGASSGFGSSPTPSFGQSGAMAQQPQQNLTAAGSNAAQGADVLVANDNTDWINKKWRPAMGWVYMATCTADFVVFPVLWSVLQALSKGNVTSQWQPLTLQGAGLYHIAMGAVLGIAAYGRTKEKIEGAAK